MTSVLNQYENNEEFGNDKPPLYVKSKTNHVGLNRSVTNAAIDAEQSPISSLLPKIKQKKSFPRASIAQTIDLDNVREDNAKPMNRPHVSELIQQIEILEVEVYSLRETLLKLTLDFNALVSNIHFPMLLMTEFEKENVCMM